MLGLYLHVPYCEGKCYYCDFYTRGGSSAVPQAYVEALLREMQVFSPCTPLRPDTLYFGGGTPSLLTSAQVARLIDAAAPVPDAEITLEANPGTVSLGSLKAFRAAGVNRLSLGVQTANERSLRGLGRKHTVAQSKQALEWARQAGFTNISGDLMLALPAYTCEELQESVAFLTEHGCTHISTYLLKVEANTVFAKRPPENLPEEDAAADFYLQAVALLQAKGFAQYEISNFAQKGYEGRHNLLYWNCQDYLGLGPAAHSCMGGKRFYTPNSTQAFLDAPTVYVPDGEAGRDDAIMLALRLRKGLNLAWLEEKWGYGFTPRQMEFVDVLRQKGMARLEQGVLWLTPQGMLLQNSILGHLL